MMRSTAIRRYHKEEGSKEKEDKFTEKQNMPAGNEK